MRPITSALCLMALAAFVWLAPGESRACSKPQFCNDRFCTPALGIALAHVDQPRPDESGSLPVVVLDEILLDPHVAAFVPGARIRGYLPAEVGGGPLLVFWEHRSSGRSEVPIIDRAYEVAKDGTVVCGRERCPSAPGLTPVDVARLQKDQSCKETADKAGYGSSCSPSPGSCPGVFGCEVAVPGRRAPGSGAFAAVLALAVLLNVRARRSPRTRGSRR